RAGRKSPTRTGKRSDALPLVPVGAVAGVLRVGVLPEGPRLARGLVAALDVVETPFDLHFGAVHVPRRERMGGGVELGDAGGTAARVHRLVLPVALMAPQGLQALPFPAGEAALGGELLAEGLVLLVVAPATAAGDAERVLLGLLRPVDLGPGLAVALGTFDETHHLADKVVELALGVRLHDGADDGGGQNHEAGDLDELDSASVVASAGTESVKDVPAHGGYLSVP